MKIMITGARGNFASALIAPLLGEGHELVLFDLEPMNPPDDCIAVQADIRDGAAVSHAMQGCDAVIHSIAYHNYSRDFRNYDDFYSVNVTGTHHILRSMLLHGVKALVYSSSDVVYGEGMRGRRVMDETVPCIPSNVFGLTKVMGEEMCRFYARKRNFNIAILRYGSFEPIGRIAEGMARLDHGIDRQDVAQANILALGCVLAEEIRCEEYLIHCAKPFVDADWPELETNPGPVIERYYPGATAVLEAHGLTVPHIHHRYDITKAMTELGYDPQHNFDQFLAELRAL